MNRILLVALALGLTGCECGPKPLPMAGTPASCRAALVAALDGWKQGRTYQEMAGGCPPLLVRDDDLNAGAKLLHYQIETDGQARGTGYSYVVCLVLHDRGARSPAKKRVIYNAVSEPCCGIFREDRRL